MWENTDQKKLRTWTLHVGMCPQDIEFPKGNINNDYDNENDNFAFVKWLT